MPAQECRNQSCALLYRETKCYVDISPLGIPGLEGFCPKQLDWTPETLRRACDWHEDRDPENYPETKMGLCLAHLAEGRVPPCKLTSLADIARDPDHKVTAGSLQKVINL